jgi:HlyD family secretion protein
MSTPTEQLSRLEIPAEKKTRRSGRPVVIVTLVIAVLIVGATVFSLIRSSVHKVVPSKKTRAPDISVAPPAPRSGESVLTVSGYIIPHERIEISPRFMGTVKWIRVKKGDRVKKDEVMVQLEDDEYRARLLEADGRLALAQANLTNAEVNLRRQVELASHNVDSDRAADEARRARDAGAAELKTAEGQVALAQTYLNWCTIRAPINGTILEKLVDPNELVVPQSFGGTRGPSTALVSLADLNDLQVEIELNEADLSKIHLNQHCRVSPEAYTEKSYAGYVAEIAPEANRSKGTLQVKVQIENPDQYLTPELTAKVDFLAD